jgi:hypothetical protein
MVIAATALAIGSLIIACLSDFPNSQAGEEYKKQLEILENYEVCAAVALGYPRASSSLLTSRDESEIHKY